MDWYVLWDFDRELPFVLWVMATSILLAPIGLLSRTLVLALYPDALRFMGDIFMLFCCALALVLAFASVGIVRDYLDYRSIYQSGAFEVVEGIISDHQFAMDSHTPRNPTGEAVPESFRVGEVYFAFHPRVIECHCFRNAGWEVSLNDGDHVRIAHIDGHILRLERRR